MSKYEKPEWVLRSLLVAVPSSVLSCLVTLWVANPTSSAPPPLQAEVDTEQILQQVAELLRDQRDAGFRAAEPVQLAPTAEREPISGSDSGTEEMSEIIDRLERLLSVVPSGGAGNQVMVQQRYAPGNWSELEALGRLRESDSKAADRSTFLLSPTEVVAQFGLPKRVGSEPHDGTLYFIYSRPGPDGEDSFASFNFKDGFVVHYRIDLSNR